MRATDNPDDCGRSPYSRPPALFGLVFDLDPNLKQCLGDGILAGRALSNLWEHTHQDLGGANDASRSERAADDLLSNGLRRALLATHTYRPPGVDQLFVEVNNQILCLLCTASALAGGGVFD